MLATTLLFALLPLKPLLSSSRSAFFLTNHGFSQLWCLQCQAYAPSFITLSLYSSTSCRGCPPSSTSALKLGLYFSVLHDCVRFVNTSRYTENLLAALIYVKLQLYHKKKKNIQSTKQLTNQKPTHKPKKQTTKQKKSPNKLATGTQLIKEIDVTVKPSKTKPQTKPRQT